jgi:UPF0755 protein
MNKYLKFGIVAASLFFLSAIIFKLFLGPVGKSGEVIVFTVPKNQIGFNVIEELDNQKLIKNRGLANFVFFVLGKGKVESGGYNLRQSMSTFQILKKISGKPDLAWVTISTCQRKEQVGENLAKALRWSSTKLNEWNNLYKSDNTDYYEGVYYPDTYLIPFSETPAQVAQRFINRFNEEFAPLADSFVAKNIKWTTGLKIASLIGREAGGTADMNTIAAVIWNRLDIGMPLQIDATMQYTLGKNANGSWWGPVSVSEKQNESPYNSYLYKGLPPTPICSPDINMITAVINPADTDCLFYLHDKIGQIHCAKTYTQHLLNIKEYLN